MTSDFGATEIVNLPCGRLEIRVDDAVWPLSALCGFAARRNRKRGFLFVSRVLGKHIPVAPSRMRQLHQHLAGQLPDLPGPVAVVAMAETATGLGLGVFDCWLQRDSGDAVFLHTTRYRLATPLAFSFDESHSHATEQLLYRPQDAELARRFDQARSLILIDDEISTGRTLVQLARQYRAANPHLQRVVIISITDWLGGAARGRIAKEIGLPTHFVAALSGEFRFTPDPTFDPGEPPDVTGQPTLRDQMLVGNFGRLGLARPPEINPALVPELAVEERPVLVLGSGEFAWPPYRVAELLEQRGHRVVFQTTTRSPILSGHAIGAVLEFRDNYGDDIPNFLYNVDPGRYRQIWVGYETRPLPKEHHLLEILGAQPIFFT